MRSRNVRRLQANVRLQTFYAAWLTALDAGTAEIWNRIEHRAGLADDIESAAQKAPPFRAEHQPRVRAQPVEQHQAGRAPAAGASAACRAAPGTGQEIT